MTGHRADRREALADLREVLIARLGPDRVEVDAPLAPLTTFGVGGAADLLVEARTRAELEDATRRARVAGVPVTWLGGGSNVVVADLGVRGLVIRVRCANIESPEPGIVDTDAGATINGLVRWTISHGLGGLQAWAGTPGTVGGAIHGNAHFGGRLIADRVHCVRLLGPDGTARDVSASEMGFGYDASRVQGSGELVLGVRFRVIPDCDPVALRQGARQSLAFRKRTQPLNLPSAGCAFRNPDPLRETLPPGVPASAGALIDRVGLKGHVVGGASVSTTHANFIVNDGGATAADIRALIRLCRERVEREFGVRLLEEVVFLGDD